jgi:N-acetylglutamate synthase-like GNAT family acetyltransferase
VAAPHIRFATVHDLDFVSQDGYVGQATVRRKIECQEVIVAESDGSLLGYVRLEYLWSIVPYISLIKVLPEYQRHGVGKALLMFVENHVRSQGQDWLYSSSQVDEAPPQAWHRHMGFVECGIIAGINEGVGELFFRKALTDL